MPKFELNRLLSYDDEALLAELRRVAAMVESPHLSKSAFNQHSKASSSVICEHFHGWENALERAGLRHRYSGSPDGKPALAFASRSYSDEQLLDELRAVAGRNGSDTVTTGDFDRYATMTSNTVRDRFGSWRRALELAGLHLSRRQKKHTEDEYFENLLTVWTHHGRQPHYGEMRNMPSTITASAYERKWGGWRKALLAFIDLVNSDTDQEEPDPLATDAIEEIRPQPRRRHTSGARRATEEDQRQIRLGLRYKVLQRDRFRCVICGRSPATHLGVVLHVDHIVAWAKGGKTNLGNLRSSCDDCNLGKGSQHEEGFPGSWQ